MATTAGISLHADPSEIGHHHHPASDDCHEYGTLDFGRPGHSASLHVFFEDADPIIAIDKAIAELVALKQEMAPPVITDPYERERDEGDADYAAMSAYCPAETVLDDADETTLYCDREAGHPGSHHAPGPDEGSEVAWGDEMAEVTA